MEYDHGGSFPFDFEPYGVPFDSKSKGKRSYPIQFERNWKYSFLSVKEESFAVSSVAGAGYRPGFLGAGFFIPVLSGRLEHMQR